LTLLISLLGANVLLLRRLLAGALRDRMKVFESSVN